MNYIIGLFLILTGFLVKLFPNLIAGYNTMPKEEKANVDVKGLSSHLRNGMLIIGLLVMLAPPLFNWLGFPSIANLSMFFTIFGGVILTVITAQKFNHNKPNKSSLKGNWVVIPVISAAILFTFGLIVYASFSTKIEIGNENLKITGIYSTEIEISSIETVELVESLPRITLKTNGFNFGKILKGNFKTEEYGVVKLYLESFDEPSLLIVYDDGKRVYINLKKFDSKEAYKAILNQLNQ